MLATLLAPKFILLCLFIASAVYVHYRGRVRHGFFRPFTPGIDCTSSTVLGQSSFADGQRLVVALHTAENRSDVDRLILFCDVERPLQSRIVRGVNHLMETTVIRASQTENAPGDRVGALNHLFNAVYRVRLIGKAIKKKSR